MKQKQAILFLTRLYHPHVGGVEKHVGILSKMLVNRGFNVTVVTERYDKKLPIHEIYKGIEIYRIPLVHHGFLKKFDIWQWVILHLKIFYKADIIHMHDVFYWLFPVRFLLLNKNMYTTFHGYEGYPIRTAWVLQRKIIEKLSSGAICVGDFMKKWYKSSPTVVTYGGVRLVAKKYKETSHSAVFFGRLEEQTGISQYLEAYKIVKMHIPDFKLTVVGDGPLKHKIPKDVEMLGFSSNVEEFIGINSFIFVSRYLSMLEALIQKKEVIAVYDNPVKRDYLLMSPFKKYVFVAKNAEEIADYVIKKITQGSDLKRAQSGYNWASNMTWENLLNTYLNLWKI